MPDWTAIHAALEEAGLRPSGNAVPRTVAGGDISSAWRIDTASGAVFLKTGPATSAGMFAAEAEGLAEIAATHTVRVPQPLAHGETSGGAFIALEWLDFSRGTRVAEERLGEQLAALHGCTRARFGWHRDNTIGLTPQPNPWTGEWIAFFAEHRLGHQLRLAAERGYGGDLQRDGARLIERLPVLLDGYSPAASLLHGDLWGGNWACCDDAPVIFDPAVYYGDRESDLAMTRLFGGFGPAFYAAYEAAWPLAPGHAARNGLYQLYHVLNHLNLFGRAYHGRALDITRRLLA